MVKSRKKWLIALALCSIFPACGQGLEVEERAHLELNYTEIELGIGESLRLVPTLKHTDVAPMYSFYSSDSAVAKVDQDGVVIAIAEGRATVRVQTSEHTATCGVKVVKAVD